jgi:hypothetical protein
MVAATQAVDDTLRTFRVHNEALGVRQWITSAFDLQSPWQCAHLGPVETLIEWSHYVHAVMLTLH